ncbi:MAG: hypothetical protein JSU72_05885 [Deltaproteobacteria bacterium]|nr:MAG: hypothetical protein JSU72_05885 [Deltaproteobacteria bacterium]
MRRRPYLPGGSTIVFLSFLLSCTGASTKLTSVWKDSTYEGGFLNSVMVVGVSDNFQDRKMFEDVFTKRLKSNGMRAVASNVAISSDDQLNRDNIKRSAEKLGIDAVLVTHLISVEEKTVYRPPPTNPLPPEPYYNNLSSYYPVVSEYTHYPGYYSKHKYVRLESNLYETATEKLIWSVKSETVETATVKQTIDSLCTAVMKNLRQNKLIR